jgi:hypothetical protein
MLNYQRVILNLKLRETAGESHVISIAGTLWGW